MTSHQNINPRPIPPPPPDWRTPDHPPPQRPPRKSAAGKIIALLIVLLLLLSILFLTPIGRNFFSELAGNSYAQSSEFTLVRDITVEVNSGDITYACDIPLPREIAGSEEDIQTIQSVVPNPDVPTIIKYGQDWVEWTGQEDNSVTFRITYRATVRTVIWDIGTGDSGMVSDIPASYLALQGNDEWEITDNDGNPTGEYMIWPSDQDIQDLSDELTSGDLTAYENIRNVYNYLRENIDYQTVSGSEPKSCLETLSDGTGDCDDQSILMISLLRAAGIPAWLAFGMLYDSVRDEWGAHAWAEVYIPLKDDDGGSVVIDVVNDEFLVRNCNRLEEWKSDGNGEHLSDYYHTLSYNYTLTNPHQQPPNVVLSDSFSGDYEASNEKVYAMLNHDNFLNVPVAQARREH